MSKSLNFWEAVATLVGTIIGAGVLGIPFAISKIGLLPGLALIVILGIAVTFVHLMVGEMMLRTKEEHQITGCIKKYIGRFWARLEYLSLVVGNYGALLAYVIGVGAVLSAIWGGEAKLYSVIFWICGSIILYFGLRWVKFIELLMVLGVCGVVIGIAAISIPTLGDLTWLRSFEIQEVFVPYGVILFAFAGTSAIFSVKKILDNERRMIKKAIVYSGFIVSAVYLLFSFIVIGVCGENVSEVATVGLGNTLGAALIIVGNIFAFFTLSTSFLSIGLGLRQVFEYDVKMNKIVAWVLVVMIPFLLFSMGMFDFITILSVVGSLSFGVSGLLIIVAYHKARNAGERKPAYSLKRNFPVQVLLFFMFAAGIAYALFDVLI